MKRILVLQTCVAMMAWAQGSGWCEEAKPALPPQAETYDVIKIVQGEKVTFTVVPTKELAEEKKRIALESKEAHAKWKAVRADYLKKNPDQKYLVPEPAIAKVSIVKSKFASEDKAKEYAEKLQKQVNDEQSAQRAPKNGQGSQINLKCIMAGAL